MPVVNGPLPPWVVLDPLFAEILQVERLQLTLVHVQELKVVHNNSNKNVQNQNVGQEYVRDKEHPIGS